MTPQNCERVIGLVPPIVFDHMAAVPKVISSDSSIGVSARSQRVRWTASSLSSPLPRARLVLPSRS